MGEQRERERERIKEENREGNRERERNKNLSVSVCCSNRLLNEEIEKQAELNIITLVEN